MGILPGFPKEDFRFVSYSNWLSTQKVAVMGAGTMGGGIAAHLANLGFDVLLFDLTAESVRSGFERTQRAKPAHFYDASSMGRVTLCSLANDLNRISEAEWVCEAIIEKTEAKVELYESIEPLLRPDAMISTNTSGLEIGSLAAGRSESFRRRFLGTHFFNPPRHLKLIELIPTSETLPEVTRLVTQFMEDRAGRRVVLAKDTPGFIANRFGMWALYQAIHTAEKLGYSPETTDAITGAFLGRPSTGVFRLADLIGLDIMEDIAHNLIKRCVHDSKRSVLHAPATVKLLMDSGSIGNKSGKGYYKREGHDFLTFEPTTRSYRPRQEVRIPLLNDLSKLPMAERFRQALESPGEIGEFVRLHLAPTLAYAAEIGEEISFSVQDFDRVMRWGWGWHLGPFELIDAIGVDILAAHVQEFPKCAVPNYRSDSHYSFSESAYVCAPVDARFATVDSFSIATKNEAVTVRDDGTGGHILEWSTKLGSINTSIVDSLCEHLTNNPDKRITLANSQRAFSAGFDLTFFLKSAEEKRFEEVENALLRLQECCELLRNAKAAAAIQGFALGGGLEMAAYCSRIVIQPEASVGLPEVLVGLIPAGGGTTLYRERTAHDLQAFTKMAVTIGTGAKLAATDARSANLLRATDTIAVNPDQLLHYAITSEREAQVRPEWLPAHPAASGMIDQNLRELKEKKQLTSFGHELADDIRRIFVKAQSREQSLEMEREAFLRHLGRGPTLDRIRHMLETGKPLNN